MRILLSLFIVILVFSNCKSKTASKEESKETAKPDSTTVTTPVPDKEAMLMEQTRNVMGILEKKDYASLAEMIHPEEGLRFSPYGHIDTARDVVMSADEMKKETAAKKQKVINWGEFDGTGDPIKMTMNEYMSRFVYGADFAKPEVFKVNTITNPGNAQNNILNVYPGSDFTDSHFSGFEKKYEGMDWQSLRLVFRTVNGKYYLVGIIHDQWTI